MENVPATIGFVRFIRANLEYLNKGITKRIYSRSQMPRIIGNIFNLLKINNKVPFLKRLNDNFQRLNTLVGNSEPLEVSSQLEGDKFTHSSLTNDPKGEEPQKIDLKAEKEEFKKRIIIDSFLRIFDKSSEDRKQKFIKDIKDIRDYIVKNKKSPDTMLPELLKKHKFLLIGEKHFGTGLFSDPDNNYRIDETAISFISGLPGKTISKDEELIVAVEIDTSFQKLIDDLGTENESKTLEMLSKLSDGGYDKDCNIVCVAIAARKRGLKVVCVDYNDEFHKGEKFDPNTRDKKMFEILDKHIKSHTKVIFYGGQAHCSKKSYKYKKDEVIALGNRLKEKYGNDTIVSTQSVDHLGSFNDRNGIFHSLVLQGIKEIKEKEVFIVPTGGPLDKEQYDYLMVNPYQPYGSIPLPGLD